MLITTSSRYEWDSGYRITMRRVLMFDRWTSDNRIINGPGGGTVRHRELPIPLMAFHPDEPPQMDGLIYEVRYHSEGVEAFGYSTRGDLGGLYPCADLADSVIRTGEGHDGAPLMAFDEWSLVAVTLLPEQTAWYEIGPVESEPWDQRMAPWR